MMDELATHVPQRVWLTGLRTEPGSLELDGMSLDHELVATLLTRLERSPYFSGVRLDASELKQVDELKLNSFRIRATTAFSETAPGANTASADS